MNFKQHSNLEGLHALLGASKYYWLNYDEEKVKDLYFKSLAAQRGTELHDFARRCIELGQRLPRSNRSLNSYVNDAIGYRMSPEVVLYYSDNCFGTTDAISFNNKLLRIHDFKSGTIPAHMEQLLIYAALFCLEYDIAPGEIEMELRIYQNDEVMIHKPTAEDILPIMDKIISFDKIISQAKQAEG